MSRVRVQIMNQFHR
ncbi:hypothetical protein BH625_02155, partial [Streptococcus pneumoniae]